MDNRLRLFVRQIRWRKFFIIMLKSTALIGVGFPLVMIGVGLLIRLFPSYALRSIEILGVSSLINFGKNGLVMGFIWGLLVNVFDIFLFDKMSHGEGGKTKQ